MKKNVFCFLIAVITFGSCKKDYTSLSSTTTNDNSSVATPTTSFTVSARDASGNVVELQEGVAVAARAVTLKYTGTPSTYRVLYTGDNGHIYVADPSNIPANITTSQTGVTMGDSLTYTYAAAGSYPITVISSNTGDKGRTANRSIVSRTITLK